MYAYVTLVDHNIHADLGNQKKRIYFAFFSVSRKHMDYVQNNII